MGRYKFFWFSLCSTILLYIPMVSFAADKLALLDLKAEHRIEENLAEDFSAEIRKEIQRLGKVEVLNEKDLITILKKFQPTCYEAPCLIDFGREAGIRYVIYGSLSKLGSTFYVILSLIDTEGRQAGVKKEFLEKYRVTREDLFKNAKKIASMVVGPISAKPVTVAKKAPTTRKAAPPEKITNSIGMSFVLIQSGSFIMGSPLDEPERSDDETPHPVDISQSFYMQTTEVTQRQWEMVMGSDPSHFKECGEDCPVEFVSWNDAQNFIKLLNKMEKTDAYRLPTEEEWEYAARAGTTTTFNTGDCISTEQANYDGKRPLTGCPSGDSQETTVKAKSFLPNAWGLYGMHGNVWEWCEDWKEPYPGDLRPADLIKGRVLRGGSLSDSARNLRSARRFQYAPDYADYDIGFRIVKDL
jgi:formylglycine-generating enzyme required for sulfatase activity